MKKIDIRLSQLLALVGLLGCTSKTDGSASMDTSDPVTSIDCSSDGGCLLAEDLSFGLLSVQIPSENNVWIVGSSPEPADGTGPAILNYDGSTWTRFDTSAWAGAELWWTWVSGDEAIFVGDQGLILEMDLTDKSIQHIEGPASDTTFFGVWGATEDDIWAVGETEGGDGPRALWRRQGGEWAAWEDPDLGRGEDGVTYFKVHGTHTDDVWFVGTGGRSLRWNGSQLTAVATDTDRPTATAPLLTIDAHPEHPVVVGGIGNGLILEFDGDAWRDKSPDFQPGFNGVCSGADQQWAVGQQGARAQRQADETWLSDMDFGYSTLTYNDWHGCAVAPNGDLWSVGGRIAQRPLSQGMIGFQGPELPQRVPDAWSSVD